MHVLTSRQARHSDELLWPFHSPGRQLCVHQRFSKVCRRQVRGSHSLLVTNDHHSANATVTTKTVGSGLSMGTGTTMHRNTTMSQATLTKHHTTPHHTTAHHTIAHTSGATFQGTQTGATKPTNTGGASSDFSASSSLALVFGALAAIMYLH